MSYSEGWVIREEEPLRMMIFVIGGSLYISNRPGYAREEYDSDGLLKCNAGYFLGEELLDWVLDRSFPALLPISTYEVRIENADVLLLKAEDLASVVSEYRSNFSRVITHPTDLFADNTLYRLKNVSRFHHMDGEVLKEISKHMKPMSYSSDTVIIEEHKPLEMMFVLLGGENVDVHGKTFSYNYTAGDVYGLELVHWITNWAAHTNFPAKLPLSPSSAKVCNNKTGKAEVAVLWVDDLKRIVSEFRSDFMKQPPPRRIRRSDLVGNLDQQSIVTTPPIAFEGKLATFDVLTMLKKVPMLEHKEEELLKAIYSHLKPMKYTDDTPDGRFILKPNETIDKMFFITRGVVSRETQQMRATDYRQMLHPYFSGNYFGEQLLEWVYSTSDDELPRLTWSEAFMCVGEVEVLVLMVEDLTKVISESAHFVRQISQDSD